MDLRLFQRHTKRISGVVEGRKFGYSGLVCSLQIIPVTYCNVSVPHERSPNIYSVVIMGHRESPNVGDRVEMQLKTNHIANVRDQPQRMISEESVPTLSAYHVSQYRVLEPKVS